MKGRRFLAVSTLFILALFLARTTFAQSSKPPAAVAPLAAIGDITEAQKRIIHNSLESLLTNSYLLISREEYNKAEELAFQQLEADQCTEEQCIRKIQEILQVDRLFVLQVVRDGKFTQLSMTLVKADAKMVQADICNDCEIDDLYGKLQGLVAKLVKADRSGVSPPVASAPTPPPPPEDPEEETGPGAGSAIANVTGWTLGVVAMAKYYQAYDLMAQSQDTYAKADETQDFDLYDEAAQQEDDAGAALQTAFGAMVGAGISWWISSALDDSTATARNANWNLLPLVAGGKNRPALSLSVTRRW